MFFEKSASVSKIVFRFDIRNSQKLSLSWLLLVLEGPGLILSPHCNGAQPETIRALSLSKAQLCLMY